ncbi:Carcinoembryonic antigen-related cell adhesion molecule 1 [Frankliniella fusca]|uniref:Carcinoembryonic antigen-related cell adhesion molecule 1 n=1 Tax=Frankliniella fusca TaxID=407009 RepID=A0AAE1I205_9NEOP|nr:Carcinoembryonic antigen-related cell adhesion molecule 1 [Frankliniella fusca]
MFARDAILGVAGAARRYLRSRVGLSTVHYVHNQEIIDNPRSNSRQVTLKQVSIRSSGVYRCEVSGEAPYFHSAHSEARMEVVYIPKDNPTITGPERQHQVGDNLALNCTSGKSHPASKLQWFINDQLAGRQAVRTDKGPLRMQRGPVY